MRKALSPIFQRNFMLLLFGFLVGMLLSRHTQAQATDALLWKVEGNGLQQPSYIYGTIHAICKDDFLLLDGVQKAIAKSNAVVLELDMDDPQFMGLAQQHSLNPGFANISEHFTKEQLDLTNSFFMENFKADMSQLGIVKPFALLSMIMIKTIPCNQDEMESYEQTFVKMAAESDKPVWGLETVEFQMSIFDQVPIKEQIKMLVESIEEMEENKADFVKMVSAYTSQNLDAVFEVMAESPQFNMFLDLLLFDRNKTWIAKMAGMMREQPVFIAVGAGHLPGEKGVLNLLIKEGYTISPVKK